MHVHRSFTGEGQDEMHHEMTKENMMSDQAGKDRNRKLMMLGGLGLGLAMLGRKRR